MRKRLLALLKCPNCRGKDFKVFAHKLYRGVGYINDARDADILPDDDIETGIIIDKDAGQVYAISEYVLIMLADADTDPAVEIPFLESSLNYAPAQYLDTVRAKIERLNQMQPTVIGEWNRDEMRYYDKAVDTPEKRRTFLLNIRTEPLWHIFLERKLSLVDNIGVKPVRKVLEIGCGNSRTISKIYSPEEYGYCYVGTDISLQRIILAKQVLPGSEFVQCGAHNLPFRSEVFDLAIAFGVLHHLPDPIVTIRKVFSKLISGGEFLIHEPINKPKSLLPDAGRIHDLAIRIMKTYEHSDHDNELSLEQVADMVKKLNGCIRYQLLTGSVIRTIAARFLSISRSIGRHRLIWSTLIAIDRSFVNIFCRRPNRLGPNAVLMIVRKK